MAAEPSGEHLAIVLPGGNFFLSAVLRLPAVALAGLGAEIRDVTPAGFAPSGSVEENRAYFDPVGDQIQAIIDERPRTRVTFVVKSIGTMILGAVGAELRLPDQVDVLWLTPIFRQEYVRDTAVRMAWRSLVVSGTADFHYDADATRTVVRALKAEELVIDGAEHNLEVHGDVRATVAALDRLATATLTFLDGRT